MSLLESSTSSMSSEDDPDQFDILRRTSTAGDVAVSLHGSVSSSRRSQSQAPSQGQRAAASSTMKMTPMMKTPTMDSLTRKYEFLLGNDANISHDDQNNNNDGNNNDHDRDDSHDDDDAYFRTPPASATPKLRQVPLERTLSYGSRHSSRHNSPARSGQGSVRLSAQSILDRLELATDDEDKRMPILPAAAASPSWDHHDNGSVGSTGTGASASGIRYHRRTQLKQNLEERLQQLEDPPLSMTPPPIRQYPHSSPQSHPRQTTNTTSQSSPLRSRSPYQPRRNSHSGSTPPVGRYPQQQRTARRQSPFHKAFSTIKHSKDKMPTPQPTANQSSSPLSQTRGVVSSTATSPTHEMSDAPTARSLPTHLVPDTELRDEDQSSLSLRHYHKSAALAPKTYPAGVAPHQTTSTGSSSSSQGVNVNVSNTNNNHSSNHSTTKSIGSNNPQHYEEDTASFWHRWKLAERRLQHQQEQFEHEKHDWVRQLESAYEANAQVEALAKRMEVQLLAVHKTCLQQDDAGFDDDDDYDEFDDNGITALHAAKEAPLDPLHLLMLKESEVAADLDVLQQPTDSDEGDENNPTTTSQHTGMDSFEYTERLERRMARTRTKNVILSHLVKLLERQAQEQVSDLKQQLQAEKDEREELSRELRQLEQRFEEQLPDGKVASSLTPPPPPKAPPIPPVGVTSPPPTIESDQHKALQHRLWMREQQYEQERKEYETKLLALQAECDRYQAQAATSQQQQGLVTAKLLGTTDSAGDVERTDHDVEALRSQLDTIVVEKEELQTECEALHSQYEGLQQLVSATKRAHQEVVSQQQQELDRTEQRLAAALEELKEASEHAKTMDAKMERLESKHGRERKQWEWSLLQQAKRTDNSQSAGNNNTVEQLEKQHELERSRWESQLQEAQADIERLHQDIDDWHERLVEASAEKRELATQTKTALADVELLQQEVNNCKEQLVEASAETKKLESRWESQLQAAHADVERLRREVDNCKEQQLEASAEKRELESQLESLRQRTVENGLTGPGGTPTSEALDQLEREKREITQHLELLRSECEENNSQISDLQSWLEESNAEVARLQRQASEKKQDPDASDEQPSTRQLLEEEIAGLEFALKAERGNVEKARGDYSRLADVIQELKTEHQSEIRHLEERIQTLVEEGRVATLEASLNQGLAAGNFEDLDTQLQDVTREMEQCQQSLDAENAKCKQVMEKNGGLKLEMQLLDKRREEETTDLNCLVESLQDEKIAHSEAQMRLQNLSAENEELKSTLREVRSDLLATSQALESEMSKCKDTTDAKIVLEKQLQQLDVSYSKEREELETRYEDLQKESKAVQWGLEEKIVCLEANGKQLKTESERLESEYRLSEKSNSTLTTELQNLNERFVQEMKAMKDHFQSLHPENDGVRSNLYEDELVCTIQQLQESLEMKESQRLELTEMCDVLKAEFKEESANLESHIRRLEGQLELKDLSYQELHERHSSLNVELQQLNQRFIKEMKEMESRYQSLRSESTAAQNELEEKNSTVESKVQELQAELSTVKETGYAKSQESGLDDSIQENLHDTALEKQSGRHEAAEKHDVNAHLERRIRQLEGELESKESSYQELQERHSSLDVELQQLKQHYFIKEMKEMESRYQSLQSESRATQNELEEKNSNVESKVPELQAELSSAKETDDAASQESCLDDSVQGNLPVAALENETELHEVEKRDALISDVKKENAHLESCIRQLEGQLELKDLSYQELHERHSSLNVELQQLNQRFIKEMKEMESRYQSLRSESTAAQNELEEKNSTVESKVQELQAELSTVKETGYAASQETCLDDSPEQNLHVFTLEARASQLQKELDDAYASAEQANEKTGKLECKVKELTEALVNERDERESQKHSLIACESSDSVRTQELIEESAERERQLAEAKKELQIGLEALRAESEKYRTVVQKNGSLDAENKELRLEKKDWESQIQALKDEAKRDHLAMAAERADLLQEVQDLTDLHEKTLKDWRVASEESNTEVNRLQQQQDELLSEKLSLHAQLAAAERQIEVMQTHHEASKREWNEHARYQSVESCTTAVDELKLEVRKMGDQLVAANRTIKELTEKRNEEVSILDRFDRVQRDMEETATKMAEESRAMGSNQEAFVRRLVEIEQSLGTSSDHQGGPVNYFQEHEALLERLRDACLRSEALSNARAETIAIREEFCDRLAQYKVDLAATKADLQKATHDLESETNKRKDTEKKVDELTIELRNSHRNGKQSKSRVVFSEHDFWEGDRDLDTQLADLGAQIENEMEEIRNIDMRDERQAILVVEEDTEEISSARQAMTAQTLLLVRSLCELIYHDNSGNDDEEPSTAVMHHLEILSELMGEVDILESVNLPSSGKDELLQLQAQSQQAEAAIVRFASSPADEGAENDLLRFELAQDDSMLDLLHDVSQDQSSLQEDMANATTNINSDTFPGATTAELAVTGDLPRKKSRASSPIELVVEQTYHRCQVLERERCDLMNVTLDLLSSAREANKAELDAALASARRRASEEMLAMKKETQHQADQIWWMLCDKCRHNLTQG